MSNEKSSDMEAGTPLLYPSMQEESLEQRWAFITKLRWAFIRKVYSILILQILATICFAAVISAVEPITRFFNTAGGIVLWVFFIIISLVVLCFLVVLHDRHPINFILLAIFTLCFGLAFGMIGAYTSGRAVLEAAIATAVVVISLTVYTFWAAKRGHEFEFLTPFLLSVFVILFTLTIFQIFYPLGKFTDMLLNGLYVIMFSVYIIYDTGSLIKWDAYDLYILASVTLYLDVLNIFLRLLRIITRCSSDT